MTRPFVSQSVRALGVALAVATVTGCSTIRTLDAASTRTHGPVVLSGTRLNTLALRDPARASRRFDLPLPRRPALDLPFSLVLDVALLGVTVPVAAVLAVTGRPRSSSSPSPASSASSSSAPPASHSLPAP